MTPMWEPNLFIYLFICLFIYLFDFNAVLGVNKIL
jgi:hypothetical protein